MRQRGGWTMIEYLVVAIMVLTAIFALQGVFRQQLGPGGNVVNQMVDNFAPAPGATADQFLQ